MTSSGPADPDRAVPSAASRNRHDDNGHDDVVARTRTAIRVEGIVQGVGFRPFVFALATRLGLAGLVGNDVDGVFAEVEGPPGAVAEFLRALDRDAPPLARVERVTATAMAPAGTESFEIVASDPVGRRRTLIAPDTATCADCLRELADPADRRFRYPFINCTNCGPRFTIVKDVPYDRPLTTMACFTMCDECAAEYHDPANRRFHAQPTCCQACGPRLTLLDARGKPLDAGGEPDSGSLGFPFLVLGAPPGGPPNDPLSRRWRTRLPATRPCDSPPSCCGRAASSR
jgi:hydrogenase maturation protein HypF